MTRNAFAVGAVVLVVGLLWVVTTWPTTHDDASLESLGADAVPEAEEEPEPAPAPVAVAPAPEPEPEQPLAAAPLEAQYQPAPPPPAPAIEEPVPDMFAEDQGPLAEYKQKYESEPRDSGAGAVESMIRASFAHPDGAPSLFKSVLCRQTICKLELNWAQDRMGAYVAGMTRAVVQMDPQIAVAKAAVADRASGSGEREIEVYVKRRSPDQPLPLLGQIIQEQGQQAAPGEYQPAPPPDQVEQQAPAEPVPAPPPASAAPNPAQPPASE
jgi:hypothetical protein